MDAPSRFEHILFQDMDLNENIKLLISGHIHSPMESVNEKGVRFINPGCLGRTEISEKHDPQVLLLKYDFSDDTYVHKYYKLKDCLKYDVVFDLDKSKQKKIDNINTELFLKSITDITVSAGISGNLNEDLINFAQLAKTDKEVIDVAIDTINIIKAGGEL